MYEGSLFYKHCTFVDKAKDWSPLDMRTQSHYTCSVRCLQMGGYSRYIKIFIKLLLLIIWICWLSLIVVNKSWNTTRLYNYIALKFDRTKSFDSPNITYNLSVAYIMTYSSGWRTWSTSSLIYKYYQLSKEQQLNRSEWCCQTDKFTKTVIRLNKDCITPVGIIIQLANCGLVTSEYLANQMGIAM